MIHLSLFQKILYAAGAVSFAVPLFAEAGLATHSFSTQNIPEILQPSAFHLPDTAQEVITKRTERSATFEITPGKYASVSDGEDLFTRDVYGQLVPVQQTGRKELDAFVFDRLGDGVRIRFDLHQPRYTLWQNGQSFTVAFAGNAEGVIENDTTIAYTLSDGVILRWTVEKNRVKKAIEVRTRSLPDLSFQILPSGNLTLTLADDIFLMKNHRQETVFSTEEPLLQDEDRAPLPHAIHIGEKDGRYVYLYDAAALALPYIIDPTAGPNSGGTFSSGGGGTIAWSNPSNAASQNGAYASAAVTGADRLSQLLNATNFSFNSISSNDTIDGVQADIYWSDDNGGAWSEDVIQLIKGGSLSGTDKGVGGTPTINTYTTYGGAADMWGTTLMGSDVNASNFGFAAGISQEFGVPIVRIDHMRLTVYYTAFFDADAPVSGPTAVPFFSWWSLSLFLIGGGLILSRLDLEQLF